MAFTGFNRRSYVGVTVTLTLANTKYNLIDLINAVLQAQNTAADPNVTCPAMARELTLQSYPGVDGVGANTNDILVGDANLTASNMAFVMSSVGGTYQDSSNSTNVDVGSRYVQSAGAGQMINVEVVVG